MTESTSLVSYLMHVKKERTGGNTKKVMTGFIFRKALLIYIKKNARQLHFILMTLINDKEEEGRYVLEKNS